jgi:hypothetical protein
MILLARGGAVPIQCEGFGVAIGAVRTKPAQHPDVFHEVVA